jgi:hypothetical protein
MIVFESNIFSGTSGSLETYWRSTLNPTPVPHIRINIASSNDFMSSTGR